MGVVVGILNVIYLDTARVCINKFISHNKTFPCVYLYSHVEVLHNELVYDI